MLRKKEYIGGKFTVLLSDIIAWDSNEDSCTEDNESQTVANLLLCILLKHQTTTAVSHCTHFPNII